MFLLDPVSILLSEPDVVTNFLYGSRLLRDPSGGCHGWTGRLVRCFHRMKIRLAVSSEIFIESYLRRNFAWYGYNILWPLPPFHLVNCSHVFSLAHVPSPLIGVPSFLIFRAFRRYNSELWLEDIPRDVKVVVALADRDEIVNTPRIDRAIDLHNSRQGRCAFVEKIIWRDAGHAASFGW